MSQKHRTPAGGRIDRAKPLDFTFDGRRLTGYAGDTLASALLANGVHLVGRSFKYHRPRGILAAGSEEPNALVTIDRGAGRTTPNLRATQVELYEGLAAHSQNRWPSLGFDVGAINDHMGALFSAGFYYKTFMGPRLFGLGPWKKIFEPAIRRAAGLGRAPAQADPDRYACRFAHCDVLVVGAGPAGLAAALSAAESGARVILCDEQAEPGGSLLAETTARIDGYEAQAWLANTIAELRRHARVRILPRTQAFGYYAQNFVALAQSLTDHRAPDDTDRPRERLWQVRATEVVLATGAIERPLVFPGNDRPGVMLADAARTYLTRYGVRAGTRILVATAHDDAYGVALDLAQAGASIALIADMRPDPQGPLVDTAQAAGMRIETASAVVETRGRRRVTSARIGHLGTDGAVRASEAPGVDLVLMSGGWTPSVHLFSQSRGKLAYDDATGTYLPSQSAQRERSAGACRGVFALADVLSDGYRVGEEAANDAGFAGSQRRIPLVENAPEGYGGAATEFPP
ncbi:MAG: 2Fe-2S iron-sulfur cluster-binding protein, partial [Variibacter sp.]